MPHAAQSAAAARHPAGSDGGPRRRGGARAAGPQPDRRRAASGHAPPTAEGDRVGVRTGTAVPGRGRRRAGDQPEAIADTNTPCGFKQYPPPVFLNTPEGFIRASLTVGNLTVDGPAAWAYLSYQECAEDFSGNS